MGRHLKRFVPPKLVQSDIGPVGFNWYPNDAWTEVQIPIDRLKAIWKIVGAQVNKSIRKYPLWMVFVLVYTEGLIHGAGIGPKLNEPPIDYQI